MKLYRLKACRKCGGDLARDCGDWICLQCGRYCYVGLYRATEKPGGVLAGADAASGNGSIIRDLSAAVCRVAVL